MPELTRRKRLEALRDMLAAQLDEPLLERREIAALSKEYRAVLAELDTLPAASEVSKSAALRARVADKWGPGAGGPVAENV